ncbi:MAG: hypothetical protein D3909_18765 [Candidatus Electrothrix sp. ATG1]|nr:hypothetical protein [Candidatus Electrothrix sp. ATG1]
MVVGYETKTEYPRFIRKNYPFRLSGKNIGFDVADADAYQALYDFLLERGRHVLEVCTMDQFGGS